ncbi:MAG: metal ABC transporter ATP-binding protein [Rhodothermales bacterium]|nr:metal ABC transporter ATP-binding protein [Rhodothermales bacterium]
MSDLVVEARSVDVKIGEHFALRNVSMTVSAGDFVAVLGPNGSGKSTFIKSLLGIRPVSGGVLHVFDQKPGQVDPQMMGYVPQIKTFDRTFPALSIDLVINGLRGRWPARLRTDDRNRALEALRMVGADHLASKRIGSLSGGELQRVYLARGLVREPRLLLLDEPATGVDVRGEADLYEVLDGYRSTQGLTIIMVTHDWEAAFHHATNILLLKSEQIAYGPPDVALSEDRLREAFGHVGHAHSIYGSD